MGLPIIGGIIGAIWYGILIICLIFSAFALPFVVANTLIGPGAGLVLGLIVVISTIYSVIQTFIINE